MEPGTITAVSFGTLQGVYRPQARVYYRNAKYGVCFETITKPLRCKSRAIAVKLAKEWIKTEEFDTLLNGVLLKISENPDNEVGR